MRITAGSVRGVERRAHPGHEQLPGILDAGHPRADRGDHALLQPLEHGAEQILLVPEVVVERAARDARPGHDLLGAHAPRSRARRTARARPRSGARASARGSDIQSVCYSPYNLYVNERSGHDGRARRAGGHRRWETARRLDLSGHRIRAHVTGEGPPIVFVHGALVNANLWRKVVPLLDGYTRVTLDLPLGSHLEPAGPDADMSRARPGRADHRRARGLDLDGRDGGRQRHRRRAHADRRRPRTRADRPPGAHLVRRLRQLPAALLPDRVRAGAAPRRARGRLRADARRAAAPAADRLRLAVQAAGRARRGGQLRAARADRRAGCAATCAACCAGLDPATRSRRRSGCAPSTGRC